MAEGVLEWRVEQADDKFKLLTKILNEVLDLPSEVVVNVGSGVVVHSFSWVLKDCSRGSVKVARILNVL